MFYFIAYLARKPQILRSSVDPDQRNWADRVPLVEFALNCAKSNSTGFAPFELNGHMPRLGFPTEVESIAPGVVAFAQQVQDNLIMAHDAIIESRINQRHFANQRRKGEEPSDDEESPYGIGKMVYLSTKNITLPKRRAKKLLPKFIGPFKICGVIPGSSAYELELSEELRKRRIFPKFHVSLLRPYIPNDETLFPHREPKKFYDFGMPDKTEWLVDEIIGHQWNGPEVVFQVKWNLGDTTWEPLEECEKLGALTRYLEVIGVNEWKELPKVADRNTATTTIKDTPAPEKTRNQGGGGVVGPTTTPPTTRKVTEAKATTGVAVGDKSRSGRALRRPRRGDEI